MKLMIVDGNSVLNRAFYAVKALSARDGTPTGAVYGFFNIVSKYVAEQSPDAVAVCFDVSKKTFRNDLYGEYKSNRKPMPEELRIQHTLTRQLLDLLGYRTVGLEGYEADDLIGTLATASAARKEQCVIVTGDRDSLQLVNDRVTVLLPSTRMGHTETTLYTPEVVLEKTGVRPDQIVDLKALMGDSSDHIPGVPGVGQKTAVDLISRFDSLDGLYTALPDSDLRDSLKAKLLTGRELAELSKTLATICRTVPMETDAEAYRIGPVDRPAAAQLLSRLGLVKLMTRFGLTASDLPAGADAAPTPGSGTAGAEKAGGAAPGTGAKNPDDALIRDASVSPAAPTDLTPKRAAVIRASGVDELLAAADGGRLYALFDERQVCVPCGDRLFLYDRPDELLATTAELYTYDCKSLYARALRTGAAPKVSFDLKLAAYLLDPTAKTYDFPYLAVRFGRADITPEPAELPEDTAELIQNALQLRFLSDRAEQELDRQGMLPLLRQIEIPLSETLSAMEADGFAVDAAALRAFDAELADALEALRERIYLIAGETFNLNSPKQLGSVLFDKLCLPTRKKTRTGYSTNAEVLTSLRGKHPIIDEILEYRKLSKLKSTYTEGLLRVIGPDGRVHTTFLQTETRTGRLSSIEPNLQNIPVRTELGSRLRAFFVARPGYTLVDADYSQIELRLLAFLAGDAAMQEAFDTGADIHTATAARVYRLPEEMITPQLRRSAKAVNFGIVYGIGAYSLSQDIGVSMKEAARMIEDYMTSYPGVAAYLRKTVREGEERGYVATLCGRRRAIPELQSKNKTVHALGERIAMNTPIQGTAADVIKIAMNRTYAALRRQLPTARLILQVHDELIVECPESDAPAAADILRREMQAAAADVGAVLPADVHTGKTWLAAKD